MNKFLSFLFAGSNNSFTMANTARMTNELNCKFEEPASNIGHFNEGSPPTSPYGSPQSSYNNASTPVMTPTKPHNKPNQHLEMDYKTYSSNESLDKFSQISPFTNSSSNISPKSVSPSHINMNAFQSNNQGEPNTSMYIPPVLDQIQNAANKSNDANQMFTDAIDTKNLLGIKVSSMETSFVPQTSYQITPKHESPSTDTTFTVLQPTSNSSLLPSSNNFSFVPQSNFSFGAARPQLESQEYTQLPNFTGDYLLITYLLA